MHAAYKQSAIKEDLDMIDPEGSLIIEFDDNFPTKKTGKDRTQHIFTILIVLHY